MERAGYELARGTDGDDGDIEVRALRTQIDVLAEAVTLARPVADQITRHAQHAAESSAATDAVMLLDSRVHHAGQQVTRGDEGVSMMRTVEQADRDPKRHFASVSTTASRRAQPVRVRAIAVDARRRAGSGSFDVGPRSVAAGLSDPPVRRLLLQKTSAPT